ncbi:unnamed protein product [Periconia digitata]|uniref:Uncharacterized protein n=1 Tax=Periconia digitata TaxID=1303443 RepID=A0A9W4XUV5_9PLEO|nr:unnamed protein product [Periconia digitata]
MSGCLPMFLIHMALLTTHSTARTQFQSHARTSHRRLVTVNYASMPDIKGIVIPAWMNINNNPLRDKPYEVIIPREWSAARTIEYLQFEVCIKQAVLNEISFWRDHVQFGRKEYQRIIERGALHEQQIRLLQGQIKKLMDEENEKMNKLKSVTMNDFSA